MNREFLTNRLAATKALIVAYEDAILALSSGIEEYTLDTGQTRQVVVRMNVGTLSTMVDSLYNRVAMIEARLNGGNTTNMRSAW